MKRKYLLGIAIVTLVVGYVNVSIINDLNGRSVSMLSLGNIEAIANPEWNDWSEWFSQGLHKDEREWVRPCPSQETGSGFIGGSYGGGSISGGGSHSQTNPSGRSEITCPYGSSNCTPVGC